MKSFIASLLILSSFSAMADLRRADAKPISLTCTIDGDYQGEYIVLQSELVAAEGGDSVFMKDRNGFQARYLYTKSFESPACTYSVSCLHSFKGSNNSEMNCVETREPLAQFYVPSELESEMKIHAYECTHERDDFLAEGTEVIETFVVEAISEYKLFEILHKRIGAPEEQGYNKNGILDQKEYTAFDYDHVSCEMIDQF